MPTLSRLVLTLVVLAAIAYGVMLALVTFVAPTTGPVIVRIPTAKLQPVPIAPVQTTPLADPQAEPAVEATPVTSPNTGQ